LIATFEKQTKQDVCLMQVTFNPVEGVLLSMTQKEKKEALKMLPEDKMTYRFVQLYQSCKLLGDQRLLLMFFLAHEEEFHLLSVGTENTKKELFDAAGIDSNNNGFNAGHVYIPNVQQWVFWYTFKYCLPTFWGDTVATCVQLIVRDNSPHEKTSMVSNQSTLSETGSRHGSTNQSQRRSTSI
jgi:hypothetical protein